MVGIADVTQHGQPLEVDPRHVLQQAIQAWRDMGLEPQMAYELEFYLCERAEDGTWAPADLPSHRVYGTGMSVDPSGAVHDMVNASLASGFRCGELVQRVRQRRLRGQLALSGRARRRRRGLPLPSARSRDRRPARPARHVPRTAVQRSGRQRHAREPLVPPSRRLERLPRPRRSRGPVRPGQEVHRRPARASPRHVGDLRADRERLQAPETRHAERLPGELGLRRPDRRRSRPARAGRGFPRSSTGWRTPRPTPTSPAPRSSTPLGSASSRSSSSVPRRSREPTPTRMSPSRTPLPRRLDELQSDTKLVGATGRLAGGVLRRAQARGMGSLRGGRRDVRHGGHPMGDRVLPPLLLSERR